MADSKPPANPGAGNKGLLFLFAGGIAILVAAGIIMWLKRPPEPPKPAPEAPASRRLDTPTPLVFSDSIKPALNEKQDAGAAAEKPELANKRQAEGRADKFGTIDPKVADSFMNARFGQVKACYERRLKINSLLEGKLDLNIGVSAKGKVTNIAVNSDTMRDSAMVECVKTTIRGWQFPLPQGGRVIVAKTFNFKKRT